MNCLLWELFVWGNQILQIFLAFFLCEKGKKKPNCWNSNLETSTSYNAFTGSKDGFSSFVMIWYAGPSSSPDVQSRNLLKWNLIGRGALPGYGGGGGGRGTQFLSCITFAFQLHCCFHCFVFSFSFLLTILLSLLGLEPRVSPSQL